MGDWAIEWIPEERRRIVGRSRSSSRAEHRFDVEYSLMSQVCLIRLHVPLWLLFVFASTRFRSGPDFHTSNPLSQYPVRFAITFPRCSSGTLGYNEPRLSRFEGVSPPRRRPPASDIPGRGERTVSKDTSGDD